MIPSEVPIQIIFFLSLLDFSGVGYSLLTSSLLGFPKMGPRKGKQITYGGQYEDMVKQVYLHISYIPCWNMLDMILHLWWT